MFEAKNPLSSATTSALTTDVTSNNSIKDDLNTSLSLGKASQSLQDGASATANPNPNPYLTSAAIVPDFNGDGKADKVWVNSATGETQVWLMDGSTVVEQGSLGTYDVSTWTYNIADFNGDNKTDFLLHNKSTGENVVALMDGTKVASSAPLEKVDPALTSSIGDFNGDRKTDILWHNTQTGENTIWQMDGSTVTNATALDKSDPALTPTIVDFDGNGKSDIFFRNAQTGENKVWFMDGAQASPFDLQSQDAAWTATLGDFNGDFKTLKPEKTKFGQ
jgi:FG-GAP-like repeat